MISRITTWAPAALAITLLAPFGAAAQEEEAAAESVWSGSAELTAVATSGNAEAETIGLGVQAAREWESAAVTFEAAGLRAESTTTRRFAVGTPGGFTLSEIATTELTAENYLVRGRFDRSVSERAFLFVGVAWDRNTFAGIDNRYVGTLGAGHHWIDTEEAKLTTTYGATYTRQEDVVGVTNSYAGARMGYDYARRLSQSTRFASVLVLDGNVDETSDYRVDLVNSIKVSMSDRLALKVSLQALFDNQPSLQALPLFDAAGVPTGLTVRAPLDDLDLLWNVALVLDF